ncbi:MAG: hypothetical protein GYB35_01360 [Algicola sp.]|nr:hypothetical protein [Algicola sp.]
MKRPNENESENVEFWIKDDILFCKFNQTDCHISVDTAKTYILKIEKLTKGQPLPFLIDARDFTGNFSPNAAKTLAKSTIIKAMTLHAFVVNTLHNKFLVASYSRIYLKNPNVQIFESFDDALAACIESKNKLYANPN